MYIFKNAIKSITRSKGRNILIGIIVLVIACASTVTLAIRNTANNLVKDYEDSHDIVASISFNRESLMNNFKGGEDAKKENIEAFNDIKALTLDDIKNYGNSDYLKGYYYLYATSLNGKNLTKATDSFEYEVEDKKTTTKSFNPNNRPRPEFGNWNTITNNTTTIITKSKEIFESARNFTGDFEIDGYSSYEAMTKFIDGSYKITEGEMISNFNDYECVINSELAKLNELTIGSKITFTNPNNSKKTYEFTVTGIYTDNSNLDDTQNMYSASANKIITGSGVIELLLEDDKDLATSITPSFILNDEESEEAFKEEVKSKELNEYYTVTTNLEELANATKSIENVKTFATTFLIITLIISSIVLFVINMINIRERKYEIGVYRTIGMSKSKLTMQFVLELLTVSVVMLVIGSFIGGYLSKPIGNSLLESEIKDAARESEEVSKNFGKGPMNMEFSGGKQVQEIDEIDAIVDIKVVLELLCIEVLLTFVSSLASMVSIQKFSPLTILKERS